MHSADFDSDLKISANLQFVIAKFEKDAISRYKILLTEELIYLIITKFIINPVD